MIKQKDIFTSTYDEDRDCVQQNLSYFVSSLKLTKLPLSLPLLLSCCCKEYIQSEESYMARRPIPMRMLN